MTIREWAATKGVSERTARNYCARGKIPGATLVGKTWSVPADAEVPRRGKTPVASPLLARLRAEKSARTKGGIYHKVQIDLTYNSNHIEGSRLTRDQTRYIFETNTLGITEQCVNIDDIIETTNHFRAIDFVIDNTDGPLTDGFIKELHRIIKTATSDHRKEWFRVGDYKLLPNEVGGMPTTPPENVHHEVAALLKEYESRPHPTLDDIIDFHQRFEAIHPFQDGNGRVGRLIMFRECLRWGIVPFIITEELKMFYYRGLSRWPEVKGYLTDTCLTAQDRFRLVLDYFRIPY